MAYTGFMADAELLRETCETLHRSGFPLVGTCRPEVGKESADAFSRWLEGGLGGGLAYMARGRRLRLEPKEWLPWARGVLCAALPYNTSRELSAGHVARGRAWVSRYAWGRDYHRLLVSRLRPAAASLMRAGFMARICVDSAPVLERALAHRAGLGFFGKNGMLIHPRYGSYLFLGEIFTDLALPDAAPVPDGCGACSLCLKGCPAGALASPRVLDAGRCVSAWTIEHKGPFPEGFPGLKGHLFGCDRCQEVCPYNRRAPLSDEAELAPREGWFAPDPARVASMGGEECDQAARGMALRRAGFEGLRRNARRILEEKYSPQRRRGTEEEGD